ncbi:MAG: isoprenylcysteine carboxylmethyltransferase family protein [Calditrichaeota bacterium]|nr:isoprenylcysteine carboxylmethyltransferase family protein [Calditrichota bacterium]
MTISPPRLYKSMIVLMLLIMWLVRMPDLEINFVFRLIGIVLFIAGAVISISAKKLFQELDTPILPTAEPKLIIESGPYKFSRNPMYLGIVIGLLGIALISANLLNLLFPVIYLFVMNSYFIPLEERIMLAKFPDQFADYLSKRRKWV